MLIISVVAKLNYPDQCHMLLQKSSYTLICCSKNVIPPPKTLPSTNLLVCYQLAAQKVVGSIPREHTYWQKMYNLNAL